MAESLGSLRVSIGLESADLTRGLADINRKLGALNSEFKATMAGAGKFDNSLDTLNQKANVLNRTLQVHKAKLTDLKRQYEESVRTKGKDAAASVKLLTQYNKALAAMRKTEDQLDLVNKRIKEQSTGFAQLGAKLNASVNTITTKMRALDAAFKASTAGVDNFGSTSDQLRRKADHLNKSIDLQQQRLKDLRRLYLESKRAKGEDAQETQELSARMNEATAQLRETQAQLRSTNTQIEQQANAWHRMGTRVQESGERMRNLGGNMQSIGSEIATSFGAATLAVGGALGLATKKSMDFEQQMSNVKSVMNPEEANKYSDALTNLAVKLGADTKYSALEAAQGMEELVKAGVSTQDIINGGLSGALSLATAGGLELADAAEIASTALNAFKDDNLSVSKAADILAGAANASATSVGEMKYGLSMTSAVAAGMGLSFKDTSTALAVFAQNGLKGSDAGTSLKTMLSRLVPMTKAQYETMSDLGLVTLDTTEAYKRMAEKGFKPASKDLGDIYDALNKYVAKTSGAKEGTDKFSKAFDKATKNLGIMDNKFFDANGNIRSMTEISGELSKALDGMSAKDKQEALYNIFGSDAIRGALILGKEGSKGFNAMAKAMDKIKAADVAAERMNNLKGRIEELSGAFETAQINIGKALTPVVSALVAVLQKVVDAFNNLSPGMQKFIAISAAVVATILGIITTFGAVLAGFGAMAAGMGALAEAGGLLAVSGTVLGSVFAALTSPISLTIAGILGLIAVFALVYKHSEQLQKLLGVVFNAIKSGALVAYNGAKVAFDGIIAAVDRVSAYLLEKGPAMWNGFAAGAVNIGTAIQSGFNSAIAAIGSFFYSLGQKASEFFGQGVAAKVADAAGIFFAQLKTAFSSVSGVISIVAPAITGFGLALAGVSGPIGFAITALVSLSGFLFRLYQSNEQFRNSVTTVWSQVSSVISSAMTALQPVFDAFSQYFGEIAAELAPEFAETMNVMVTSLATLKPAFAELGAAIAELGPSFAQLGATFASLAGELGIAFSNAVVQITPLLGELASAFTQMLPGIISLVSGLLNVWVQVQGTLLQVITSIVTTVLPILVEGFTSLLPIVLNVVQAVFPVILSLIQAIAPVIQMIATTVLPVLLSAVQAIFPVVLAVVKAVMPFVATIIQLVASVIKDLVVNVLPLILEVVKAVFPLIVPIIQYATQIIIQVLKAAAIIIKTVLIPAVKFILSIVQAVFPVIVSVIRAALNIVTNVIKLFSAVLRGDWKAAWNAVLGILKAIFSPIVKLVTNMGKAISDKWTYVKNKMALLTYEMKKK
ncbi:phage tail tape measure protein [Bacillus velezensis]|nr:phage tail tape measure protein [Bacillus velezensis]